MSENTVRKSLIKETSRNIDNIAKQLNEGAAADKELMIELINNMLDFCDKFVIAAEYNYMACADCDDSYADKNDVPQCKAHNRPIREVTPKECKKLEVKDVRKVHAS